jgi:tRNA(His) 5'-end guanylyltransferase
MNTDSLGDRMKAYEGREAERRLLPLVPALARIDGRCFSRFTGGLERPFDARLSRMMIDTTRWLVRETGAVVGYCQSDEITLAWHSTGYDHTIFFAGRIAKMTSQLAALTSVYFYRLTQARLPTEYAERLPTFDARVWNVPTTDEAANCFLWRELDATKNSLSMAARHYYSHSALHERTGSALQELLFAKGVNWNDYPAFFKRGTLVQRHTVTQPFTTDEVEQLPPLHAARRDPGLLVERTEYVELDLPPLNRVTNRTAVLFAGAEPIVRSS